ncbi:ComEC/Rec2 family competence protein [Calothrix sp. 336/3]|uniref:ComEC/Rec2 family competence protein n=1 Tax=Calothrix sp. 336/3 TaxID=1337936 RepID=UPI0004E3E795|nr:ComEC/Rec2 family competence protein [Calothrix sp. 336/3]AKG21658.1 competence protein [Calothrix sp. 336/3]
MVQTSGIVICLSYILGLLLTAIPWGGFLAVVIGIIGAVVVRRLRLLPRRTPGKKSGSAKTSALTLLASIPHSRIWLIAGLVGLFASFYFQLRVPQPSNNDISKFAPSDSSSQEQLFIVRGKVLSTARLTRSQRGQFWLEATQLDEVTNDSRPAGASKGVSGKLYVTVPLLQSTGLHPGQEIAVTGVLYQPKAATNPGGFDFRKYLQQESTFAGLSGRQINILEENRQWGWWQVREKIVRSQVKFLGIPQGPLVSAMVLGSKAVDLPYETRDLFVQAGLAHALAASGFQTSLILGVVLGLTKRAKRFTQIFCGSTALIIFLCLTGFQPAVLRAVVMGFAALIGLGLQRQVNQFGSLLLAAVLLLLFNPQWIWDLGFQLSFLATLGLIVTVSPLTQGLSWLPPAIASLIAVPVAATIWTLPLQLQVFGVVPTYSLLLNIVTTPFISIISLGGFISALIALVFPDGGSAIASFLNYPTSWLINLVTIFSDLPGNTFAVGKINIGQTLVIYTLIIISWLVPWWQKRWWLSGGIAIALVFLPVWYSVNTLFQVTMLAGGGEPVVVVQDRGKVTVINSGDDGVGKFTVVPFLQQQGINHIDWAIATDFLKNGNNGWVEVAQNLPVKLFYDYAPTAENALTSQVIQKAVLDSKGFYQVSSTGQTINTGSIVAQLINDQLPALQMQVQGQSWLFVGNTKPAELKRIIKIGGLPRPQVLWCSGEALEELVTALQPKVAISPTMQIKTATLDALNKSNTKLFFTNKDGAIQWTPEGDFTPFTQIMENKTSIF